MKAFILNGKYTEKKNPGYVVKSLTEDKYPVFFISVLFDREAAIRAISDKMTPYHSVKNLAMCHDSGVPYFDPETKKLIIIKLTNKKTIFINRV